MVRVEGPYITEINPLPLFTPTGDVTRFFEARMVSIRRRAKVEAPDGRDSGRTQKSRANPEPFGYLKSNINAELSHPQPLGIAIEIRSEARYSTYVIKGTGPTIRAKLARLPAGSRDSEGRAVGGQFAPGARGMVLPPNFGYRKGVRVQSVRGQKANDFLSRAVTVESVAHISLLGYDKT